MLFPRYNSWERVKELVVVTLLVIMKLAKTMRCCFFKKVKWISVNLRCDGENIKRI